MSGRPMEIGINVMTGAIVRLGERVGVPTPSTATLTQPVKALEQCGVRKGKPLG